MPARPAAKAASECSSRGNSQSWTFMKQKILPNFNGELIKSSYELTICGTLIAFLIMINAVLCCAVRI